MKLSLSLLCLFLSFSLLANDDHHAAESKKPWIFSKLPKTHQKEYFSMSSTAKKTYGDMLQKSCDDAAIASSTSHFKKKGIVNTDWNQKRVEKDLQAFVKNEMKIKGNFTVQDKIQNVLRTLKLEKIHTGKILRTPDGTSFICADFKDKNGDKVDVDFFVTPGQDGAISDVKRVKVHKVNGKVRYKYLLENNVWVEKALL